MKPKGIEYVTKKIKYACFKVWRKSDRMILPCNYLKEQYRFRYICHTYFSDGYRKYGAALSHSTISKKLTPFRTGIERTFGLVNGNRHRMERTSFYKGIDHVTIHAVEHDIVLTQDIIFDYIMTGKKSPALTLRI